MTMAVGQAVFPERLMERSYSVARWRVSLALTVRIAAPLERAAESFSKAFVYIGI
jgi:hypothetical protein